MPIIEIDVGQLLLAALLVVATFAANVFVGAIIARRVGVGKSGDYLIGFITGAIGTAIPLFFITGSFPVGLDFALTFVITAGLAWGVARWARTGDGNKRGG